jgi:hypothetical protein
MPEYILRWYDQKGDCVYLTRTVADECWEALTSANQALAMRTAEAFSKGLEPVRVTAQLASAVERGQLF